MAGYKQALARFEAAVRNHEMLGAQHPFDHEAIEREYQESRQALIGKLNYREYSRALKVETS